MPPHRRNRDARRAAASRINPLSVLNLICAKCATGAEFDYVPAADEPLTIGCRYERAGASSCKDCAAGNKVCQSHAMGLLGDVFDMQVVLRWSSAV